MSTTSYVIPANYTDAGRLFGMFETRNAIESAVLGVPILFLCIAFLPLELMAKVIVTLTIFVPAVGFALIGLADDSLLRYLNLWRVWRRRKAILSYRGEVNQREFERTYLRRRGAGH